MSYLKKNDWELIKNFTKDDFKCPCCGKVKMDFDIVHIVDKLKDECPTIKINSGYRCKNHNEKVGGTPNSAHLKGLAVDIGYSSNYERAIILIHLIRNVVRPIRIGIGKNFIHFDLSSKFPNPRVWLY